MPPIRIGTPGYSYFWNKGSPSPFIWYVKQGFNSVEINATFYRFPASSWIETWQAAPEYFAFSIKVHRSKTHYTRLKGKSIELWKRFSKALVPLEEKVEFWLFQMPPNYIYEKENMGEMKTFFERAGLESNAVVEFRDPG